MSEYAIEPDGTMAWQHTNVWGAGRLLATYSQNTVTVNGVTTQNPLLHFYLDDPLGTRRVQTDYAGNLEQTCSSLPYGDSESCGASPTEHLFTGKERDSESGNDYFGARYYASTMGRFMSPDWSAKEEPVPYAKLDDPQTLNLYSYLWNNPLAGADADGHAGCKNTPELCRAVRDAVSSGHSIVEGWAKRLNEIRDDLPKHVQTAKKAVDTFNSTLGFGKTNCAGGGSCDHAFAQALGAVVAAGVTGGESEEPELAALAEKWSKGTFESVGDSLAYHFGEHGEEVAAKDMLHYLRKADGFASNLERSKTVKLPDGAMRFIKNGRYIIKDAEGKILSFGKVSD
jgi:RHS repeat-associated protein